MLRHSLITLAIFLLATVLYFTGVTDENQPLLFIVALCWWFGGFLYELINKK
jgi:uncharacterized membrane protein YtjA (UPF0391 family)